MFGGTCGGDRTGDGVPSPGRGIYDPAMSSESPLPLVIVTEWKEFRALDFEDIKRRLREPVVFDGRNLYDPLIAKDGGIEYFSIGRP